HGVEHDASQGVAPGLEKLRYLNWLERDGADDPIFVGVDYRDSPLPTVILPLVGLGLPRHELGQKLSHINRLAVRSNGETARFNAGGLDSSNHPVVDGTDNRDLVRGEVRDVQFRSVWR